MKNITTIKKGDLVLYLIGFIFMASLLGFYLQGDKVQGQDNHQRIAVITRDGHKIAELDLNQAGAAQYITLDDGIHTTIVAENGSIRFLEADCPDKICVKTGTLTEPGDQAICMPGKTIVRILED